MGSVVSGLETLLEGNTAVERLQPGARIALLAHPASIDRHGRHALELLLESRRYRVLRLFAPEHGLWGREQDMETVDESHDTLSGLPVRSLYGQDVDSLRPRPADLEGLDAIVCDLQDVGSRYYTFVYTVSFVMEAARDAGVPVIVLDRPNPIGGVVVEGPILDPALSSFVGRYPLPVRHGMTVGELARLFNDAFDIGCELEVVPLANWSREMHYDVTGLPWVAPSPNMPTPTTAQVYPGGCLVEGTNLSEGRGTTQPFELIGAPWLDGNRFAAVLRESGFEGAVVRPASFRPMFHKHAGESCEGVQVIPTDRSAFRPFADYLVLLREARRLAPESFQWRSETYEFESTRLAIDLLLGQPQLREMLESAAPLAEMAATWQAGLQQFEELRGEFLLYS